jgi:hypothetical protein
VWTIWAFITFLEIEEPVISTRMADPGPVDALFFRLQAPKLREGLHAFIRRPILLNKLSHSIAKGALRDAFVVASSTDRVEREDGHSKIFLFFMKDVFREKLTYGDLTDILSTNGVRTVIAPSLLKNLYFLRFLIEQKVLDTFMNSFWMSKYQHLLMTQEFKDRLIVVQRDLDTRSALRKQKVYKTLVFLQKWYSRINTLLGKDLGDLLRQELLSTLQAALSTAQSLSNQEMPRKTDVLDLLIKTQAWVDALAHASWKDPDFITMHVEESHRNTITMTLREIGLSWPTVSDTIHRSFPNGFHAPRIA